MTVLTLSQCENCTSLPSFGLLSSLKDLTVTGMKNIKILGSEFYRAGCSKPFQSLETLYFGSLLEWEHWEHIKENEYDTFPSLHELYIEDCPKLSGRLPERLPSLKKLTITNCKQLLISFSSIPMLCELDISGCRGMSFNSPIDFKSLKSATLADISEFGYRSKQDFFLKVECLNIKNVGCEQLMSLWQLNDTFLQKTPQGLQSFFSITQLRIENCTNLVSFPEICFLFNLSKLEIRSCNALTSLPEGMNYKNARLESLKMEHRDSLIFIVRGQLPSSLKWLVMWSCEKLEYLWDDKKESDEENNSNASLLEILQVYYCPSLTFLSSSGQLPETLQHLEIELCESLTCLSSNGHLPEKLRTLYLGYVRKLKSIAESFYNNNSLEEINIWGCRNLETIPEGLHNLSHLRKMGIANLSIVCFAEDELPNTNLSELRIDNCWNLKALPNGFHNLNSLKILRLNSCPSMASFPQEGFPTNLTDLEITEVDIYKPLLEWGLYNLTSLTSLYIGVPPEVESFPQLEMEMTLPPSLIKMSLSGFPNLKCLLSESFRNHNSLEELCINECPNFTNFLMQPKHQTQAAQTQDYNLNPNPWPKL